MTYNIGDILMYEYHGTRYVSHVQTVSDKGFVVVPLRDLDADIELPLQPKFRELQYMSNITVLSNHPTALRYFQQNHPEFLL